MTPAQIRSQLVLKQIKQCKIAESLGVKLPSVNQVISGKITSRRIRQAVANAIGMRVDELWPERHSRKAA